MLGLEWGLVCLYLGVGGMSAHVEEAEAAECVGGEDTEGERAEDGAEKHEEIDGVLHVWARLLIWRQAEGERGEGLSRSLMTDK